MNYTFVRTRIAPSPTGLFHIGTARTALINYIFARQNNGEFLMRLEDTDQARNQPQFEEDIKSGLKWLGLNWDGEIVYQKNRTDRYREIVEELVKKGNAYEKDGAIWFKISPGNIEFDDLIRGKVSFHSNDLKDFVILRSDKTPIFYLSGAVDDHESGITHVIRGEEHLSNTPKQILIIETLGWNRPVYAHVPLILNPDRSKMSKRKDPVSVSRDFMEKGYLPKAIVNYLALLGWHPSENFKSKIPALPAGGLNSKSEIDIYNLEEITKLFDISRMQKGGAVFDQNKLDSLNRFYISQLTEDELNNRLIVYQPENISPEIFQRVIQVSKDRLSKLSDIKDNLEWLEVKDYPAKWLIFSSSTDDKTKKALKLLIEKLQIIDSEPQNFEDYHLILKSIVEDTKLQNGDVFWSARVALSGLKSSPPPAKIMWVLGKDESINRIKIAIDKLAN